MTKESTKQFRTLALLATWVVTVPTLVLGGEIVGRVAGDDGEPLPGVVVCLKAGAEIPGCLAVTSTDETGSFAFLSIEQPGSYSIEVPTGRSDADCASRGTVRKIRQRNRRAARVQRQQAREYWNYVWEPASVAVTLETPHDRTTGTDFSGTFNFSNFQHTLCLNGADFPELVMFDLVDDHVFLKVYTIDGDDGSTQDLIYLGQVRSVRELTIEASLPLSVDRLYYEIFSAVNAVSGTLSLGAES